MRGSAGTLRLSRGPRTETSVMAEIATRSQILLARVAALLIVALSLLGLVRYGFSGDVHERIWRDILDRPGGPETFRFVLQPVMAAVAALHDGARDARAERSPYLWSLLTDPTVRASRLQEGLISTARIILLGIGMDAVYQATVFKTFYPGEMVIIAILLAFIPYLLLRGPFARVARWWSARKSSGSAG
jgi:hypothetical protein